MLKLKMVKKSALIAGVLNKLGNRHGAIGDWRILVWSAESGAN